MVFQVGESGQWVSRGESRSGRDGQVGRGKRCESEFNCVGVVG